MFKIMELFCLMAIANNKFSERVSTLPWSLFHTFNKNYLRIRISYHDAAIFEHTTNHAVTIFESLNMCIKCQKSNSGKEPVDGHQ